ncbi:MAG TPA: helix-hairpin-helix domain-containing protein [Atribacter sp.]|jgi:competence protein ComEA|uniref:ComE operon protein 1 n=1 Tax=Candidatus Atribacter allofermentans TaxID=1852833 RepID=A0A1V5T379_9BACT|nr:helix-hairpin-helix domain-containing protein [Atribacter sp.]MDD3713776.1 helix-hairpin-helix domain-containing protein [Atribacterota bacterium]OQA60881.1 MAG: ComE operon protein 1 [Candidatus Atribacteria bacterium ADurb.Bin276]HHT09412.1 hypothetical protein [Candidatus Atribacteria bacterium]MDI9595851.1 helix-hairpin-helix domain-containing protein [Atribacterota bacterium]HQK83964.1 helix-hairpin-helix domain-containing protein [Atribacter sp.]
MAFSRQERIVFIILSSILVFSTGFLFYKTWTVSLPNKVSNENRPENYIIQIAGEVLKPGVYQVEEGTRLYQLIELAGGVSPQADISSLNLAAPVHDGLRINIPAQNSNQGQLENSQLSFIGQRPLSEETDSNLVVQINTASLEELKRLPGIGDVIAQRIIEYRKTYGPFQSVEDLINVKGIGTKKLQDIKESISF